MVIMKKLADDFGVTSQVAPQDIADIAAQGYRSVVCNRPDGEGGPDQPSHEQVAQAAREHGLAFAYVPVIPGRITEDDVKQFSQALAGLPGPVLAYCRTGNRSGTLYQMSQQG